MKRVFRCIILLLLVTVTGCDKEEQVQGTLTVTFIDVGQADAILLECNKHYMLIDGGTQYKNSVYLTIDEKGINDLDYVFCTHPDEDHVGGLVMTLENKNVAKYFCSASDNKDTIIFSKFKDMVQNQGKKIIMALHHNVWVDNWCLNA